jgi:hypothetical protein
MCAEVVYLTVPSWLEVIDSIFATVLFAQNIDITYIHHDILRVSYLYISYYI